LALLLITSTSAAAQGERILSFDSYVVVHPDASMTVRETIQVQAEGNEIKRGIYRDFPQLYGSHLGPGDGPGLEPHMWGDFRQLFGSRLGLRHKTGFEVLKVLRDGQPEAYHLENRENGKRVYIGRSDVFLKPGAYTYELTYKTDRQLGFFGDHDELYWNVTGNGWIFPIEKATATVVLPTGAKVIGHEAYTGPTGAKGQDYVSSSPREGEASFATTRELNREEGLTIVVSWPKGFVSAPERADLWLTLVRDNPGVSLAVAGLLLVLFYYLIVWAAVGQDPRPGTIIPLYGPPQGFSPAAVRDLVHMHFDNTAFTAALIGLAVKGAITIKEKNKEYTIERTGSPALLWPEEEKLLKELLGDRSRLKIEQSNHATISGARKALKRALTSHLERKYFVRNVKYWLPGLLFSVVPLAVSLIDAWVLPVALFMLVWLSGWTVGVTALLSQAITLWRHPRSILAVGSAVFLTAFSIPFIAGELFGLGTLIWATSVPVAALFAIGALMNGVFYHLLKAPTLAGRRILDQIEGFKMYLSVAEKDRLNWENPPERTSQLFEMFLPYALALGVEQQWSEQFASVLAAASEGGQGYSPSWYSGPAWSAAAAAGIGSSLGSFGSSLGSSLSGAISSASTAPGSSSGDGGGGSSGGGGGGGGGGGW